MIIGNIVLAVGIFLGKKETGTHETVTEAPSKPVKNKTSQGIKNPISESNSVDKNNSNKDAPKINLSQEQREVLNRFYRDRIILREKKKIIAKKNYTHYRTIKDFVNESKMSPVSPEGYFAEPMKKPLPQVNIMKSINREKQMEIHTIHSSIPLNKDAFEYAASKYVNQNLEDFVPYDKVKIDHPDFKTVNTFIIDDENPVVAVVGIPKNSKDGSMVIVTVHGDGENIRNDQEALKEEFSKIQFLKDKN